MIELRSSLARVAAPLFVLVVYVATLGHLPAATRMALEPVAAGPSGEELRAWLDEEQTAMREGRWKEARVAAERLVLFAPSNHVYLRDLAEIGRALGDDRGEAEAWERFLEVAPVPVHACPDVAFAYRRLNRLEDYRRACERCLAFDGKNSDSLFCAGHANELAGNFARARELYDRGLAVAPGYADLTIGLARIALKENRPEDAERLASEALAARPGDGEALEVRSRARSARGAGR